jgi:ribosomal protein S27AE
MNKILEAAARRPCPTCGGRRVIFADHIDGQPCPDCQDDTGQPTGLWLECLTVPCRKCSGTGIKDFDPADGWGVRYPCNLLGCHGTGRILSLTTDNIDAAMERLGFVHLAACQVEDTNMRSHTYLAQDPTCWFMEIQTTRQAARIGAAEAVIKDVWPEVENEV